MNREKLLISIFIVATVFIVLYFYFQSQKSVQTIESSSPTANIINTKTASASAEPKKIEFGAKPAPDFPTNIPLEQGVNVKQSYGLDYIGQKQLTFVFVSMKTLKENYALYSDFLKKDTWTISNKYESEKLASLYGIKGNNEINVTVDANSSSDVAKSMISISVLKK